MNNKFLFIVFVICGLLLSSLVLRDGKLLVLTMPFLVYLLIAVFQAPTDMTLVANRIVDKSGVVAQEPVETHVTVRNEGNSLLNLELIDSQFPAMTICDGQTRRRVLLSVGETIELNYAFTAERGVYTWRAIRTIASDPFGLFELQKEIPADGELVVRPASLSLGRLPLKPRMTLHSTGPVSIRLSGSSTDFLGIREYRSGDSLRRLNWRLAARHPHELFTNEYEREEIADFGLILDARKLTDANTVEEILFENSVRAALSLSETFLKQGNRVAMLVFGEVMSTLLPGYGKKQLNRIVRSLARAQLGSNVPLGYLEYFPTRLFPSRSILIILSMVGPYDHEIYARLRSFGYDILLIAPDPVDFASQILPQTQINSLAVRAARVERVVQLKRLMKLGIQVINWQVNQPLETILQRAISDLTHRRNT
jgi:uncharacterized protein (DUF58 family)